MKPLLTFLLLLSLAIGAQAQRDRVELGSQTTSRGIIKYGSGLPTYKPKFRPSRDSFAYEFVDTLSGLRYVWEHVGDYWQTFGLKRGGLPPLPTQTSGLATVDNRTAYWSRDSFNLVHRFDAGVTAWVPARGLFYLATVPTAIAATGSNGAATYTSTLWKKTTDDSLRTYIGGAWRTLGGGGSGAGDDWGSQVAQTTARLSGNGTSGSPLDIAQQAATSGQALKWNGSAWAPANDNNTTYTGGTGISVVGTTITNTAPDQTVALTPSGLVSISGTYPSFTVGASITNSARLTGAGTAGSPLDFAQNGATNGQVYKWNGSVWAPGTDNNTTYTAGTGISVVGTTITNTAPDQTVALAGAGLTSISGTYPSFTVTSTLTSSARFSGAGTAASPLELAQQSATSNQVLKWNGSSWAPAADNNTTYTAGTGINLAGNVITNTAPDQTVTISPFGILTLTGSYPAFNLAVNIQNSARLTGAGSVASPLDIAQQGATSGQALKWNGSSWAPAADNNTTYTGGTGISVVGTTITNTSPDQTVSLTPSGLVTVSGTYPSFTVGASITNSARLTGAGTSGSPLDLAQQAATSGQVLKWNGSSWAPGTDNNSGGSVTGAANGLSLVSGNVELGGTLTKNTTIDHAAASDFILSHTNARGFWSRQGGFPGTGAPTAALVVAGDAADPLTTGSGNTENGSLVVGANTGAGTMSNFALHVGAWADASVQDGIWLQGRQLLNAGVKYPVWVQPLGGTTIVGAKPAPSNYGGTFPDATILARNSPTASGLAGQAVNVIGLGEAPAVRQGFGTTADPNAATIGVYKSGTDDDVFRVALIDASNTPTARFSVAFGGEGTANEKFAFLNNGRAVVNSTYTAATSMLKVNGSIAGNTLNTLGAATIDVDKHVVVYSGTTNVTLTMDLASSCSGRFGWVMNHSAASTVTLSQSIRTKNGTSITSLSPGQIAFWTSDGTIYRGGLWTM
jgi:hypothetical protein